MKQLTRLWLLIALLLNLCIHSAHAMSLAELEKKTLQEIRQATTALVVQRERISNEKIPLEKELTRLEAQVKILRREAKKIQDIQDSKVISLTRLEEAVDELQTDNEVITAMLSDFESKHKDKNKLKFASITQEKNRPEEVLGKNNEHPHNIFELSIESIERAFGGEVYQGEIVDKSGAVNEGKIVHIGSSRWFLANNGDPAGLVMDVEGQLPSLYKPVAINYESLQALIGGESVQLEIDVSNGKALLANATERTLLTHLNDGGIWVVPILVFSVLAVITALIKGVSLHRLGRNDDKLLADVLHNYTQKQDQQALEKLEKIDTPLSKLLQLGIANMHKAKAELEDIFYAELLITKPKVERYLGLLAVVASTAPLLGLLGTVTGLINTFELLSIFGTGNAETLSGGISEALITTELGLVVAIPALILHVVLSRKAKSILSDMEKHAQFMLNARAT